jgi:hypothetical protein
VITQLMVIYFYYGLNNIFFFSIDEFRAFLENELIDTSMAVSLQEAVRLNWWTCLGEGCEKLWPLSTTGDGNCLLHAASLGIFHCFSV